MRIDRYYYLSALPAPGGLGSAPPMGPAQLLEHVGEETPRGKLVGTVFLLGDLLEREAFLAGEIEQAEPTVLTVRQVRNEAPLPEYLAPQAEADTGKLEADALWEAYFRHADEVGRTLGSPLLCRWVGFEAAFRNALAEARAKRLGIEGAAYLVATDLAESGEDFSAVLSEWAAAPTPLDGLRATLRARWEWLAVNDAWFSFSDDELVAYALRLMLLEQWRRTTREEEQAAAETA
ncbi:MAG: hypothetical protein ACOCWL_00485 [Thermoguttaceae bacterium]